MATKITSPGKIESLTSPQSAALSRGRAAATFAASLELENVSRVYGDAHALDGVSLTIAPGEIVALLGPSGCGKTTLLRVISGIERPTAGRVLINAREVAGPERFVAPEKRGVGLMFQDFALFPHLNVLDNVAFGLRALAPAERKQLAQAILERVGLGRFANTYPSTLSGGQQQRVALARAIVPRPAVMLMDEPFSGLDVQLRDTMQEETLGLLRETRATSLIVTHNAEEAMRLGDRIAVMSAGKVIQAGKSEALYAGPASLFVARLFSEINEVPVQVKNGSVASAAGTIAAPGLADGTSAVLCIRERGISLDNGLIDGAVKLSGRILNERFMGDSTRLEVAVEGFDQPLKVRINGQGGPKKGQEVRVAVDPAGVLVFPSEP